MTNLKKTFLILLVGFLLFSFSFLVTNKVEASDVPCGFPMYGSPSSGGDRAIFGGATGSVFATAAGKATVCTGSPSHQNAICNKHYDGRSGEHYVVVEHGGGYTTVYRKLTEVAKTLNTGDTVSKGQELGNGGVQGSPEYQLEMNGKMLKFDCIKCYMGNCEDCECCPQEPAYCPNCPICDCCFPGEFCAPCCPGEGCEEGGCCISDCICDGCPRGGGDEGSGWGNEEEEEPGTPGGQKTATLKVESVLNSSPMSGVTINWGETTKKTPFNDSITLPNGAYNIQAINLSAPQTHVHSGVTVNFDKWEGCSSGSGTECVVNFNPPANGTETKTVIAHYKGKETTEPVCGIEQCHGLNITCGSKVPEACTMEYKLGDGCRKYVECKIVNGKCTIVKDSKFDTCKSCVEKCEKDYPSSGSALWNCETKCIQGGGDDDDDDDNGDDDDDKLIDKISCVKREKNAITLKYSTSKTGTVAIFRANTRVHLLESKDNRSGEIKIDGLKENTSYKFSLREGRFSYSNLLFDITCKTTEGAVIVEESDPENLEEAKKLIDDLKKEIDKITKELGDLIKGQKTGTPSNQSEINRIEKEIARLMAIVSELIKQGSIGTTTTPGNVPVNCQNITFTRNLSIGTRGNDVKCLQSLLNVNQNYRVADSGPGSPGNETDYFGPATKAAVIKFQNTFASQILHPLGLTSGTGFVGASTRKVLNALIGR